MCGIFLVKMMGKSPIDINTKSLLSAMSHRGPDASKTFISPECILGHTRLSIIDLDSSADQPFIIDNFVLSYNGEVFNYLELQEELMALGHYFETSSDTEVVLRAYIEWGATCVSKFNGMWAFSIYDSNTGEIFYSRDRFGMKPLFKYENKEIIVVASEIQVITKLVDNLTPNLSEIRAFIREGSHDTGGLTFFNEIREIQPATYSKIDNNGKEETSVFWHYPTENHEEYSDTAFKDFDDLFASAVDIRLRSDVDVAVLLSGGVDSTLVAAQATAKTNKRKIRRAMCYASGDESDERFYASQVADRLGLPLDICEMNVSGNDYLERLSSLVHKLGKGHSSPAIVPVSYLYQIINEIDIKVALDGQGADELLGGYKNYFLTLIPYFLRKREFSKALGAFKDQLNFGFFRSIFLWLRFVLPPPLKYLGRWLYGYESYICPGKLQDPTEKSWLKPRGQHKDLFNRYLINQHREGLTNLLYYGDIVSMANSVENRSPFMDHRLVDFVFSQGSDLKVQGRVDKFALRRHPDYFRFKDVLERKKIGFNSPIPTSAKIQMIADLQTSPIFKMGIFKDSLRKNLAKGLFLKPKMERFLFRIYQVHLWDKIFFSQMRH
jgi:asparagine synthase (glutamine-hydrolysing)